MSLPLKDFRLKGWGMNRTAYLFTNYTGTPAKKPESASTIASEVAEALRIIAREKARKYRAANRKRAAGAKA